MEDLDPPREEPGAADNILQSLRAHGLHWDESVLYQSSRSSAYAAVLATLAEKGLLFSCDCTRAMTGPDSSCRGDCRERQQHIATPWSVRAAVPADCLIEFSDLLQGAQRTELGADLSDFVVQRKDGLYAYQLAVVVDDAEQEITHIVRGSDLLDSTPRQIFLQQVLNFANPQYCHLPVITTARGQKFSKQNHAPALHPEQASHNLRSALQFLRQRQPPAALTSVDAILAYASDHWELQQVPAVLAVPAASIGVNM